MIKKLFFTSFLILALSLVGGIVKANGNGHGLPNAGLLPGHPFYFLDTLFEGVGTLFTPGDKAKAERFLGLAEERLAEAEALAEQGRSNRAEKATEKYEERLAKAVEKAEKAKAGGRNVDDVLAKIAEAAVRHQEVLAEVYERVPEQAKATIERVMAATAKGHETALSAVSGEKQDEVRNQVEQETEDVEERLKELRGQGVPIPDMNTKGKPETTGRP